MTSPSAAGKVTFRLHLFGAINFVPCGDYWWALLPAALAPFAAKWRPTPPYLSARSTHIPALVVDSSQVAADSAPPVVEIKAWDQQEAANLPFPASAPPKAVFLPHDERLAVSGATGTLEICRSVADGVPPLEVVSPKHKDVSQACHPEERGAGAFLSGALKLVGGNLRVEGYFGDDDKTLVEFGFVTSLFGRLMFRRRRWNRPVANHLVWEVDLADHRQVNIRSEPLGNGQSREYKFNPINGLVEAAYFHGEVESVTLFQRDAFLLERLERLPDPDFEMYYPLSTRPKSKGRVPVPPPVGGGTLKPCAPTRSRGFA